jgi:hypothetical protein
MLLRSFASWQNPEAAGIPLLDPHFPHEKRRENEKREEKGDVELAATRRRRRSRALCRSPQGWWCSPEKGPMAGQHSPEPGVAPNRSRGPVKKAEHPLCPLSTKPAAISSPSGDTTRTANGQATAERLGANRSQILPRFIPVRPIIHSERAPRGPQKIVKAKGASPPPRELHAPTSRRPNSLRAAPLTYRSCHAEERRFGKAKAAALRERQRFHLLVLLSLVTYCLLLLSQGVAGSA